MYGWNFRGFKTQYTSKSNYINLFINWKMNANDYENHLNNEKNDQKIIEIV